MTALMPPPGDVLVMAVRTAEGFKFAFAFAFGEPSGPAEEEVVAFEATPRARATAANCESNNAALAGR